jgi:hypothetical protein
MNGHRDLPPGAPPRLEVDRLLEEARRTAGLSDFGDPWFLQPLARIVELVNTEAALTSTDISPIESIKRCLVDRLRRIEFVKHHPAVVDEKVQVAGVIVGIPRGGSTLLQRLVCSSPQITAPYFWETMSPLPLPGEQLGHPEPRIRQVQAILDGWAANWPGSTDIHPTYAEAYDEESPLLERSFLTVNYIFFFHVPGWMPWLLGQDQIKAYAELKLWLQILQYQDPLRRTRKWVLKSGQHIWCGALRYLLETFPEAKALMSHRSLEQAVPSACSLQSSLIGGYTRDWDPRVLGPETLQLYEDALTHLIEVREVQPAERFIDLQYADLVREPIQQFRQALTKMGLAVGHEDEAAVRRWLEASRADAQPRHAYRPEDFGLTAGQIGERFRFYTDRYLRPA